MATLKPGDVLETIVNRFDGGMVNDGRTPLERVALVTRHFDIFTRANRLTPNVAPENGNASQTTQGIRQFIYYNNRLFGLGVTTVPPRIYYRDDFTGSTWSELNNGAAASGTFNPNVFVEYKGNAYGWFSSADIWKADLAGSNAFTAQDLAVTGTGVQGLVHSKDDILYMPYNTTTGGKIAKKNDSSWTAVALSLPQNMLITSICEYGNYLAIACAPRYFGNSVVYLWDRDTSLTTLSESIDFGAGSLRVIEELEGYLVGVSISGDSATSIKSKVTFRRYGGAGSATVFNELEASSAIGTDAIKGKQKVNSKLYFLLDITIDGQALDGVWCVGRSSPTSEFGVSFCHDPVISGGDAVSSLTSFALIGDYMFIVYNDGADKMSKTNDSPATEAGYNIPSIYESRIFNNGDISLKKQLKGIFVTHEPLGENGEVTLKYKKDSETDWTTIFTHTTQNSVSHASVNIESTGLSLPEYHEIQLRIESKGGAEITSFGFVSTVTGKRSF